MANSHKNFLAYLTELNLTPTQEDSLRTSLNALVTRIKDACGRVVYAKQGDTPTHHIDLAVYRVKSDGTKLYAHLADGWQKSDQSAFKKWFKENKTEQLQRM